jgi:membrane protease YdiL (CAAX protease family)
VIVEGNVTAGLVLLVTAFALAPVARALADRLLAPQRVFFARWGFTHVLSALLIGFGAAVLSAFVPGQGILMALVKMCLITAVVVAWCVACARRLDPEGLGALGVRPGANLRSIAAGVGAYVLLVPAWAGVVFVWPAAARMLGIEVVEQEVLVEIVELFGTSSLWLALFLAIAVQPLLEEVVFRGFLQPLLVQNLHEKGGIVATSVLFGLMHGLSAFLPIFALSLLLGWIQLRTQRLAAAWAVHALHNGLVLALGLALQSASA